MVWSLASYSITFIGGIPRGSIQSGLWPFDQQHSHIFKVALEYWTLLWMRLLLGQTPVTKTQGHHLRPGQTKYSPPNTDYMQAYWRPSHENPPFWVISSILACACINPELAHVIGHSLAWRSVGSNSPLILHLFSNSLGTARDHWITPQGSM